MLDDIIAVTNRKLCERPFEEQIERVCKLKPKAIILREKDLSEADYEQLVLNVFYICKKYDVPLIAHTYAATAIKLGIKNVHFSIENLRKYINKTNETNENIENNIKLGCSIHSVKEAVEAEKLGASYITAGHIYKTDCKKGVEPRGLEFLKEVCRNVDIPVYAIGGIQLEGGKREQVIKCGASGSCIMSGLMNI